MPTALVDRAKIPYEDRTSHPPPQSSESIPSNTQSGERWVSILLICEATVAFVCCPIFGYLIDVAPTRKLPYLLGLILLGASMLILCLARTIGFFVIARLLQGGATAMVVVAGLALLTDSVPFENLGQTVGYLGSAVTLGFLLGPLLGGLVYRVAGYQPVFAMAFAIVGIDLVMRFAVIEKRVAKRWMALSQDDADSNNETNHDNPSDDNPPQPDTTDNDATIIPKHSRKPTLLLLLQQPRILISSWGLLVHGMIYAAFDAVRPFPVHLPTITKSPNNPPNKPDNPHLRRIPLQLDPPRRRPNLPPLLHDRSLRALLRYLPSHPYPRPTHPLTHSNNHRKTNRHSYPPSHSNSHLPPPPHPTNSPGALQPTNNNPYHPPNDKPHPHWPPRQHSNARPVPRDTARPRHHGAPTAGDLRAKGRSRPGVRDSDDGAVSGTEFGAVGGVRRGEVWVGECGCGVGDGLSGDGGGGGGWVER